MAFHTLNMESRSLWGCWADVSLWTSGLWSFSDACTGCLESNSNGLQVKMHNNICIITQIRFFKVLNSTSLTYWFSEEHLKASGGLLDMSLFRDADLGLGSGLGESRLYCCSGLQQQHTECEWSNQINRHGKSHGQLEILISPLSFGLVPTQTGFRRRDSHPSVLTRIHVQTSSLTQNMLSDSTANQVSETLVHLTTEPEPVSHLLNPLSFTYRRLHVKRDAAAFVSCQFWTQRVSTDVVISLSFLNQSDKWETPDDQEVFVFSWFLPAT